MARTKKTAKKVTKKTNKPATKKTDSVEKEYSFDEVRNTTHEYGKQARAVLEEEGCNKCEEGTEKFVYTSTYIRGKRVYIEVICTKCMTKSKVLMPELAPDDV